MTSQWNPDPRRARPPSLARIMYVRALMLMLRFSLFVVRTKTWMRGRPE